MLCLINFLRQICDHGENLFPLPVLQSWKLESSGGGVIISLGEQTAASPSYLPLKLDALIENLAWE